MNKKELIGIIVLGVIMVTVAWPLCPLVWIYLLWMVRKKTTKVFHDQMEQELAERRLRRLKTFLLIAGVSLAVGIVGVVLHNVSYAMSEEEEAVFFFIALSGLWVASIGTMFGLVIFLTGRRRPI